MKGNPISPYLTGDSRRILSGRLSAEEPATEQVGSSGCASRSTAAGKQRMKAEDVRREAGEIVDVVWQLTLGVVE